MFAAPLHRSRTTRRSRGLALAAVGALLLTAAPSVAAQAAPVPLSAVTNTGAAIPGFTLSYNSSKVVALPSVPAGATAVTMTLQGRWSWKPTRLSVCAGSTLTTACKSNVVLTTPVQDEGSTTFTLPLPSSAAGKVTVYNLEASVRVALSVASFEVPGTTPAPTPKPTATATPTPTATPKPTATPTPAPAQPQFATAASTGVPAGTALKVVTGDLVVTTPGAVVDAVDVRGFIKVKAPNVTIKRSIVRGRPLTGSFALITNDTGAYPFTVEDSELIATEASPWINGIIGHNFTVRRTEIANVIDSVHITGSNVVLENSWLHGNLFYAQDPNQKGGPSHADSIQIQGGSNMTFRGNTIDGAYSSAMQTTQDRAAVSNVTVTGNKIDGGGCSINIAIGSTYGAIKGFNASNNVFGTAQRHTKCAIVAPTSVTVGNVNNVFTDGTAVRITKGA
ncbi:hypothetical protein [Cellulomonas sp. NS3]|uniref:hypothetical protein n=1 Tax=Cellulomonas sp. NS3 TaxID=2973977 RepID=UPI002161A3D0|nr:hypothetical protein [Cellulomonas sp. NS3]